MTDTQLVIVMAALPSTITAIAGLIVSVRTGKTTIQHGQQLQDITSVVSHTAESLDNHITDEQPVIEAAKALAGHDGH